MHCILCDSNEISFMFRSEDFEHGVAGKWTISKCMQCGFCFQDPMPKEEELQAFYPATYSSYNSNTFISLLFKGVFFLDARRIFKMVGPEKKILDIGSGSGNLLLALKGLNKNYQLTGLEIDSGAVKKARKAGLNVKEGFLAADTFQNEKFDLIRMGHVIEHVPDPMKTFRIAHNLLESDGILFGETPNTDCLDFRITRKYWGALHLPRHLTFFNSDNLVSALREAGFNEVILRPRLRTVGWSTAIQNWLVAKGCISIPATGRVAWYVLLIIPFLPVTFIQSIFNKTGTLCFIATKVSK